MDFEKYNNKKPYPSTKYGLSSRHLSREQYEEMKREYYEEDKRIYEQFKLDLFEDLGISDNPKKEILFSLAWEHGHANGYSEIYYYATDFVRLVK